MGLASAFWGDKVLLLSHLQYPCLCYGSASAFLGTAIKIVYPISLYMLWVCFYFFEGWRLSKLCSVFVYGRLLKLFDSLGNPISFSTWKTCFWEVLEPKVITSCTRDWAQTSQMTCICNVGDSHIYCTNTFLKAQNSKVKLGEIRASCNGKGTHACAAGSLGWTLWLPFH